MSTHPGQWVKFVFCHCRRQSVRIDGPDPVVAVHQVVADVPLGLQYCQITVTGIHSDFRLRNRRSIGELTLLCQQRTTESAGPARMSWYISLTM